MQLSLRPCVTGGVAVIAAGLIHVTPPAAPDIGQPAVALAAAWDVVDVVGPIDAVAGGLGGGVDLPVPSPAYIDTPQYLDPAFWQYWWTSLWNANPVDSWFMLINALSSIPIIGPVFSVVGLLSFALYFFAPHPAAADGMVTGLQDLYDSAQPGASDPVLLAEPGISMGDSPVLDDLLALFGGASGPTESTAVLEDPGAMLELAAVLSILEPSAAGFDMGDVADTAVSLSIIAIPELDDVLTSLIS